MSAQHLEDNQLSCALYFLRRYNSRQVLALVSYEPDARVVSSLDVQPPSNPFLLLFLSYVALLGICFSFVASPLPFLLLAREGGQKGAADLRSSWEGEELVFSAAT